MSDEPHPDKLHPFSDDAITVTWSKRRCLHVAECIRLLPDVFAPGERPWIRPESSNADAIARAVEHCPTGALHYERHDGGAAEAVPATNTVRIIRNGPLHVRGMIELHEHGALVARDTRIALCRCGQSKNKPFCDNSHIGAHFTDRGELFEGGVKPGEPEDARALVIDASPDGPLKLSGPVSVISADHRVTLEGGRTSLCRCGQSRNKPFCDGSHITEGFTSE